MVKYRDAASGGPFDWKLLRPFTAHETVTFEQEVRSRVSLRLFHETYVTDRYVPLVAALSFHR